MSGCLIFLPKLGDFFIITFRYFPAPMQRKPYYPPFPSPARLAGQRSSGSLPSISFARRTGDYLRTFEGYGASSRRNAWLATNSSSKSMKVSAARRDEARTIRLTTAACLSPPTEEKTRVVGRSAPAVIWRWSAASFPLSKPRQAEDCPFLI
jgi:hypothetical protein